MLEEGVGDHRHERMTVKALPGSSLEVIKTEFFFQLLVSLLANPSRLDGGRQGAQVGLRRQVGEIVFLLSRHPVFADEPSLVPGQMLLTLVPDPLRWSVGDPHADSSKTSLELSFRSGAPTDGAAMWRWPACLRPPSIECQERVADGDGRVRQPARSSAHRRGTP